MHRYDSMPFEKDEYNFYFDKKINKLSTFGTLISICVFLLSLFLPIKNIFYFQVVTLTIFCLFGLIRGNRLFMPHPNESMRMESQIYESKTRTANYDATKNNEEEKKKCLDVLCNYDSLLAQHYELRPRDYYLKKMDYYQGFIEFAEKEKEMKPFYDKQKEIYNI